MRRLIVLLVLMVFTLMGFCQTTETYSARISNYKDNDTINLDDLLKMKDLFVINKECQVIGFVLVYNYTNYDFMMISKSNNLTEDMKIRLLKFKSMNVKVLKITFKAITIKTPKNEEIKIKPIKYILKIK